MAELVFEEEATIEATFQMDAVHDDHNLLVNRDLPDQHPMSAITGLENTLDSKVEKTDNVSQVYGTDSVGNQTTYDVNSFGQVDDVQVDGISIVENKIANLGTMALESLNDYSTTAVADTLYAAKSYETTIDNHIANTNNPHEVTKSQVGLGNVDNTSDLNKPISTATQTALDGKADKATTLAGYGITDAYTKTEVDTALNGKQDSLDTTQMEAVNSGANATNIGQIATNTQDISNEATARENADINLQRQIDAITSASDVTDIVGTYAELQAYDTSSLPNNSIIKVIQDESRDDETTYYRWVITGGVGSWVLIGEEGPYYTKSQADSTFVPQTRTINNKALSSNVTLTASDVGALPDNTVIPTVNNATLTLTQNGTTKGTFTANASSDVTINLDSGGKLITIDSLSVSWTSSDASGTGKTIDVSAYTDSSKEYYPIVVFADTDKKDLLFSSCGYSKSNQTVTVYRATTTQMTATIDSLTLIPVTDRGYTGDSTRGITNGTYQSIPPYYTKSESDTLLSAKQNNLTAGAGIDITNNVISVDGEAVNELSIDNVVTQSSSNLITSGAVYSVVGDIETLLQGLR